MQSNLEGGRRVHVHSSWRDARAAMRPSSRTWSWSWSCLCCRWSCSWLEASAASAAGQNKHSHGLEKGRGPCLQVSPRFGCWRQCCSAGVCVVVDGWLGQGWAAIVEEAQVLTKLVASCRGDGRASIESCAGLKIESGARPVRYCKHLAGPNAGSLWHGAQRSLAALSMLERQCWAAQVPALVTEYGVELGMLTLCSGASRWASCMYSGLWGWGKLSICNYRQIVSHGALNPWRSLGPPPIGRRHPHAPTAMLVPKQ